MKRKLLRKLTWPCAYIKPVVFFFCVCVKTLIHSYRKGFVHHINIHQKDHSEVRNVSHACSEEVDRHMPWVCHSWYNEKIMDFRIIIIIE